MSPATVWVFDLDNTLHNATPHIFPHISRAMTGYLQAHLGLDEPGANALRIQYWQRYGATLLGLIRHHPQIDPDHFLWHTHQFPQLHSMLVFERGLRGLLRHLPGKKILFSNAPAHYAQLVLAAMGIEDLFSDVISVERTGFRPKPDAHGFRQLLLKHGIRPARAIMVEDDLDNLRTAKRLGMRTVWVTTSTKSPPYVDVRLQSVLQLRRVLSCLGTKTKAI
ncbi:MAG: pyrimidine 5'-nucleotidase [Pseudomonadota bacterium]